MITELPLFQLTLAGTRDAIEHPCEYARQGRVRKRHPPRWINESQREELPPMKRAPWFTIQSNPTSCIKRVDENDPKGRKRAKRKSSHKYRPRVADRVLDSVKLRSQICPEAVTV
ncbi:hypothetical protein VTL71DRAFT_16085, partial [Oculimacula yallundae]